MGMQSGKATSLNLQCQLAERDDEIERLRGALESFGSHDYSCPQYKGDGVNDCDCGFDGAIDPPASRAERGDGSAGLGLTGFLEKDQRDEESHQSQE